MSRKIVYKINEMVKNGMEKITKVSLYCYFFELITCGHLKKTWAIYAIIVGVGFIIRTLKVKEKIIAFRKKRNVA